MPNEPNPSFFRSSKQWMQSFLKHCSVASKWIPEIYISGINSMLRKNIMWEFVGNNVCNMFNSFCLHGKDKEKRYSSDKTNPQISFEVEVSCSALWNVSYSVKKHRYKIVMHISWTDSWPSFFAITQNRVMSIAFAPKLEAIWPKMPQSMGCRAE